MPQALITAFLLAIHSASGTIRLAVTNQSAQSATLADLAFAEIAKNEDVELLERQELERIFDE